MKTQINNKITVIGVSLYFLLMTIVASVVAAPKNSKGNFELYLLNNISEDTIVPISTCSAGTFCEQNQLFNSEKHCILKVNFPHFKSTGNSISKLNRLHSFEIVPKEPTLFQDVNLVRDPFFFPQSPMILPDPIPARMTIFNF